MPGALDMSRILYCTCVIRSDPQSRSVGHRRHGGLFDLLLLPVDDEEEEEEEHQQHQDDDSCDGSDLIRVHLHGCAGETVEASHHHTSCREEVRGQIITLDKVLIGSKAEVGSSGVQILCFCT